jgi:hypothetical protein
MCAFRFLHIILHSRRWLAAHARVTQRPATVRVGGGSQIAAAAKKYRVFYSLPPNLKEGDDYLVDHSIFFYLMGRDGEFVDFFGTTLRRFFAVGQRRLAPRSLLCNATHRAVPRSPFFFFFTHTIRLAVCLQAKT